MSQEIKKKEQQLTDLVLDRFTSIQKTGGIDVPQDYSAGNALKAAFFELQTVTTKDKKPALTNCDQKSVMNSLFEMVTTGLNPLKKQCYFVVYGNHLTLMRSYQGNIALAKRYSGVKSVIAREIYKDDEFITQIDATGHEKLIKHDQPFKNTDGDIIGGYCIVVDRNGVEHLTKMTKKKIESSWNMGATKGAGKFHQEFTDEAVKRTLINRACKPFINSSNDEAVIQEKQEETKDVLEINAEVVEEKPTLTIEESKEEPEKKEENKQFEAGF